MENNFTFSFENLRRIAVSRLSKLESISDLVELAKILWCKRYNRPLKDPLLLTYTPYELLYEVILWEFLDSPESIEDFIRRDNGQIDAIMEDDENWFQKKMGQGYSTEEIHAEDYWRGHFPDSKKSESVEDLPDGSYDFKELARG